MDHYIRGAVEEYLKHNRTVLEGLRDQGVFSQADVESELENIKSKIEKDIETNKAYAMLLMEIEKEKYKDEDGNEYVSLTEIARLKNFKNPSYVIQSWLRDRNTLDFLFQWETENNMSFQNNTMQTAYYLPLSSWMNGCICCPGTEVWYRFTASASNAAEYTICRFI